VGSPLYVQDERYTPQGGTSAVGAWTSVPLDGMRRNGLWLLISGDAEIGNSPSKAKQLPEKYESLAAGTHPSYASDKRSITAPASMESTKKAVPLTGYGLFTTSHESDYRNKI